MKPVIYIVCGPMAYQTTAMEKYRREGYDPIIVSNGNILRGRKCGKVVFEGAWEDIWNLQEIEESIENFKQRCGEQKEREEIDRDDNFFDYGVDE